MKKIDIIILAGYDSKEKKLVKIKRKKLIRDKSSKYLKEITNRATGVRIYNKPLLQYMIDIYKDSEKVGKVIVVGPKKEFEKEEIKNAIIVDQKQSLGENVLAGIEKAQEISGKRGWVGVSTCDLPFLTTAKINKYLKEIDNSLKNKEFIFQIIEKEILQKNCNTPYSKPGYSLLENKNSKPKKFALGHLHFVRKEKSNSTDIKYHLNFLYRNRHLKKMQQVRNITMYITNNIKGKKKFRIGRMLWATRTTFFNYLKKKLTFEKIEESLGVILGALNEESQAKIRVKATKDFEFGMDLDTVEELHAIRDFYKIPLELSEETKKTLMN